jgi:hypothetical protein
MDKTGVIKNLANIRKQLKLKSGSQFVVLGKDDVVILKAISPPSTDEFDTLIAEARRLCKEAGLKKSHITAAINRVRGRK